VLGDIPDDCYAEYELRTMHAAAELREAQRLVDSANWHDMREWREEPTLLGWNYAEAGVP